MNTISSWSSRTRATRDGLILAVLLLNGCGIIFKGATIADIETEGAVALNDDAGGQVGSTQVLTKHPPMGAVSLAPVVSAVVRGLEVRIDLNSNEGTSLSLTNQSAQPMLIRLQDSKIRFSFDTQGRPLASPVAYTLFSLGPPVKRLRDVTTHPLPNPMVLEPNQRLAYGFSWPHQQVDGKYLQNFAVAVDHQRHEITQSGIGNSLIMLVPVEIAGEKLVLKLTARSVREYLRKAQS